MMKETASQAFTQKDVMDKSNNNLNQVFWKHVIEREVVEDSDTAFELKITKCLWEKVYRESDATDIGYAIVCHTDFLHFTFDDSVGPGLWQFFHEAPVTRDREVCEFVF